MDELPQDPPDHDRIGDGVLQRNRELGCAQGWRRRRRRRRRCWRRQCRRWHRRLTGRASKHPAVVWGRSYSNRLLSRFVGCLLLLPVTRQLWWWDVLVDPSVNVVVVDLVIVDARDSRPTPLHVVGLFVWQLSVSCVLLFRGPSRGRGREGAWEREREAPGASMRASLFLFLSLSLSFTLSLSHWVWVWVQ